MKKIALMTTALATVSIASAQYGGIPEVGGKVLPIVGLVAVVAVAGFFLMKKN